MTTTEFLAYLRGLDIQLSVDGDRLRVSAPKGALSGEVRDVLATRKKEILAFLRGAHRPGTGLGSHPLSSAQQRLWFINQLAPGNSAYNIPVTLCLTGLLNVSALESSLAEIVGRHDALRTTVVAVDGQPIAVVAPAESFSLSTERLEGFEREQRESEMLRLAVDEARGPFDLARGPLFRAKLIRLDEQEHVLLIVFHHIVADGWSMGVFVRELATCYDAYATANPSPVGAPPIQYGCWAIQQQERMRSAELDRQLRYWTERLRGALPVLEIPSDRPRPAVQSLKGARQLFCVEADLLERLRALCRAERATLFMALMATLNALLCRYTGQEDVLIGTPIANRTSTATEGLIGLFANTLVLRTDCGGDPPFRELVSRVRDGALEAFANQDLPFDRLVEALQPARDMSHPPVFQVMFSMQNMPVDELRLTGLTIRPIELHAGTARLDLTVEAWERPEGMRLYFEYNTDLFDSETIVRMGGHFRELLSGAVADPDTRISALPLLREDERHQAVTIWNATDRAYPSDRGIHELIEAQVARTPDAVAAVFGDASLTYRAVNEKANRVAHRLRAMGVGPDVRVGICLERSLDLVVGVLGILKAGGAYLPLDPSFPADRLAFMLEDAKAPVLVTEGRLTALLPTHQAMALLLDREADRLADEPSENPKPVATADHLAYVIYTSGSTGRPKGVLIPHRAVVNFLSSMQESPGLTARDVLVAVTTLSFDIAGLELFLPLTVGARVVLADRETTLDGQRLAALLERAGGTVMQATPATWRLLLASGWNGKADLRILCGGEPLSRELATALIEAGASLWNLYGPTETTIWSTVHEVRERTGPVLIGRPIANTRLYVLDRHGNPVPVGVPGELWIGGHGVARGYLDRPELTAERFAHDLFSEEPGARMYRTGDLARFRPDGVLEHLGRMDDQVKVRGFRVEIGEIEAVLAQHPAVRQSVVVTREDGLGERRLAAYLIANGAAPPISRDLRAFLAERLPDYMVPSSFTILSEFPLTPNGKVDRRRLPAPEPARASTQEVTTPRNETERTVARIWSQVLGADAVGVEDNFFEVGGHSLLLAQVQSRVRSAFDCEVSILELFQYPTVRAVAEHLIRKGSLRVASARMGTTS